MRAAVYIHAAGGIGAQATPIGAGHTAKEQGADAQPVSLRAVTSAMGISLPRLASRFAALAVAGAGQCTSRLAAPLAPGTPVYLASGLGDVARTDALYYEVMPPRGEMASPAQFATSGNNMGAFFVAQQLGLVSRNVTLSQGDLSFEYALQLALDDLAAGVAAAALVGGVDETTLPREFYVRRYPPSAGAWIGEGSAWLALGTAQTGAVGEILGVSFAPTARGDDVREWARGATATVRTLIDISAPATLLPGTRISPAQIAALSEQLPAFDVFDYRRSTGCLPTAAALAVVGTLVGTPPGSRPIVHVNCDARGRTGILLWRGG